MKAICKNKIFRDGYFIVEEGDLVNYTVKNKKFIVNGYELTPAMFFNHFKVTDGEEKINYSEFEYILCNYIFTDAVLFPEEYSDIHHLIIQISKDNVIMITVNKNEDNIRVSFDDMQKKYTSYEDALDGIKNHEKK